MKSLVTSAMLVTVMTTWLSDRVIETTVNPQQRAPGYGYNNSPSIGQDDQPERGARYTYSRSYHEKRLPAQASLKKRAWVIRALEKKHPVYSPTVTFSIQDAILRTEVETEDGTTRKHLYVQDKQSDSSLKITDADAVVFPDGLMVFPSNQELGILYCFKMGSIARKLKTIQSQQMASPGQTELMTGDIENLTGPVRNKSLQRYLSDQDIAYDRVFLKNTDQAQNASPAVLKIAVDHNQNTATVSGILNARTPYAVYQLNVSFPNVDTLILEDVPGSHYTYKVMDAGILIRSIGLKTALLPHSHVASAGTLLYWSGHQHKFAPGATLMDHGAGKPDAATGQIRNINDSFQAYLDDYLRILAIHPLVRKKTLGLTPDEWVYFTEEDMAEINAE